MSFLYFVSKVVCTVAFTLGIFYTFWCWFDGSFGGLFRGLKIISPFWAFFNHPFLIHEKSHNIEQYFEHFILRSESHHNFGKWNFKEIMWKFVKLPVMNICFLKNGWRNMKFLLKMEVTFYYWLSGTSSLLVPAFLYK